MFCTLADWTNVWVGAAVAGFLLICVLLILTVLIQRPQGGGLAGAFGSSAGSGQTAFGAKTGDALTIFTIAVFVAYLLVAVGLNYAVKPGAPAKDDDKVSSAPATPGPGTNETLVPIQMTPSEPPPPAPGSAQPQTSPGTEPAQTPPASPGTSPSPAPGENPPANPEPKPSEPKPEEPKPSPTPP